MLPGFGTDERISVVLEYLSIVNGKSACWNLHLSMPQINGYWELCERSSTLSEIRRHVLGVTHLPDQRSDLGECTKDRNTVIPSL